MIDSLIEWFTNRMIDSLIEWSIYQLNGWFSNRVIDSLIDFIDNFLIEFN